LHGSSSRRGGISGKRAKPTMASPVVKARLLRHWGKTPGRFRNSNANTTMVTKKWAVPYHVFQNWMKCRNGRNQSCNVSSW
jgi:hypothetical protein